MAPPSGQLLHRQLSDAFAALNAGQKDRAEKAARGVLKVVPREPNALYLLGVLAHQSGDLKTAAAYFEKSYKADPKNVGALAGFGIVRLEQKRGGEAEKLFRKALSQQPNDAPLLNNLGLALKQQGRLEQARDSFALAARGNPRFTAAHINMGDMLKSLFGSDVAVDHYERILKKLPKDPDLLYNYAVVLADVRRLSEAVNILDTLVANDPANKDAGNLLASITINLGDLDKAEALYRTVLAHWPDDLEALLDLSELLHSRGPERKAEAMAITERAVAARDAMDDSAAALDSLPLLRLANAYEKLSRYDDAFAAYRGAQRLLKENNDKIGKSYRPKQTEEHVDRLIELFGSGRAINRANNDSGKPIFIVGLPRSGTTMLERILGARDGIHGAGELPLLPRLLEPHLARHGFLATAIEAMSVEEMDEIADGYLSGITELNPDARFVVDKLPSNFNNTGLIRLLFPNATVIHSIRNLLDTCLSIYTQSFSNDLVFDHDLKDTGHYCTQYVRLMRFWHRWDPELIPVRYEDVVANSKAAVSAVLDRIGLPWEDEMASFHERGGEVLTASRLQVRQPIYKSSVEKWRRYEAHLGPLIAALGPLADTSVSPWDHE